MDSHQLANLLLSHPPCKVFTLDDEGGLSECYETEVEFCEVAMNFVTDQKNLQWRGPHQKARATDRDTMKKIKKENITVVDGVIINSL